MKEKSKTGKVLNIISNVFFCLVMVLLIIFMVYGFGNLSQNKVPSFFGQSYVRIMSGSMSTPAYKDGEQITEGFEKNDIVVLEKRNVSEIEVGDIVAFYNASPRLTNLNGTDETPTNDFKTGANLPEDLNTKETPIVFHQVISVGKDSDGNLWFNTKGTSNTAADGYTRADYVVGVYTDSGLAGFLEFISSSTGIIVLVVIPSCIVLLMLLLNIIQIVDKMIKDKKEEEARRQALLQASMAGGEQQQADTQANTIGLSDASMKVFQAQLAEMDKAETTQTDTKTPPQKPNIQKPPVKPTIQKTEVNAQADAKPAETTQTPDAKQEGTNAQTKTPPQKPVINKSAEAKPADAKTEAKSAEAKATEKPAEKATEAKSAENKPAEAKKADTKTETAKTEAKAETKSSTAKVETKPTEAKPADTKATTSKPAKEATTKKAEEKPTTAKTETAKAATKPIAKTEAKPATKSTTAKKAESKAKAETKPATKTTAKKTDTDKK